MILSFDKLINNFLHPGSTRKIDRNIVCYITIPLYYEFCSHIAPIMRSFGASVTYKKQSSFSTVITCHLKLSELARSVNYLDTFPNPRIVNKSLEMNNRGDNNWAFQVDSPKRLLYDYHPYNSFVSSFFKDHYQSSNYLEWMKFLSGGSKKKFIKESKYIETKTFTDDEKYHVNLLIESISPKKEINIGIDIATI